MRSNQRIALFFALFCIVSLLAFNFTSSASMQGKKEKKAKAGASQKTAEPRQSVELTTQKSKKTGEEELRATDTEEADDPDLPPGMAGRIDKEEYLRARGDYIDLLRGRTEDVAGDARDKAIQQLEKQESLLRERAKRGLASPVDVTNWTFLGPAPIPQGQTTGTRVPVSGRTIAIAVHPTNPDIVYVGTAQGGLYKSINGGTNWTRLFDFQLESLAIGAVTIDPVDSSIVYVGTGEPNLSADSFAGKGLYIIRNANSASPTLTGPFRLDAGNNDIFSGRAIGRIVVNPADNNVIFVCTTSGAGGNPGASPANLPRRGIYRSTNAQSANPTFSQIQITGITQPNDRTTIDLALDPANPNLLIATVVGAASDGGIYRTANALDATPSFTRTQVLPDGSTNGRAELYLNRNATGVTIYAATGEISTTTLGGPNCSAATAGLLRRSTDGGITWSTPLPGSTGFCGGQCFYDMAIVATPDNQTIHLGGAARSGSGSCIADVMKRSTNGGTSFARNDTVLHADEHALAIAPSNPNVVYTGSDGGIWRSTNNGTNWTSLNNTEFSATQFQGVTLHPFDRNFLMGGTQDNGTICRAADGTFTHCRDGDGGYALIDTNAQDTTNVLMYHTFFNQTNSQIGFERAASTAANADGQLSGWTFRGCSGVNSNNGIGCADKVLFYAPMALGPGNPNTLYFGTDRLYRSINRGDTMTSVSQLLGQAGSTLNVLTTIDVSPQDDNVRLVGLRNGKVFATATGSTTMTDVTGGNFPPGSPAIGRVAIDPNNKFTAYVSFTSFAPPLGQQIFKTTNLNDPIPTWVPASNGIPQIPVTGLAIDPQDSNSVFAATDIGVYHSTDGGANWAPYGLGLPRVAIFDVKISNVQRVLRIATHGRGIWEIGITGRQLPVMRNGGATLVAEGCSPANGVIDPNEDVTVSFAVTNIGPGATQNLVVTLQPSGGVTFPDAPQSYGMVDSGTTASRNFRFSNNGTCGGTITLTFHLQDGDLDLGNVSIPFTLGLLQTGAPVLTENFDGVTAPNLPASWTTARSSTATNTAALWVTSTTTSDTAPNSAFGAGGTVASDTSVTSPTIPIPNAPAFGTNPGVRLTFRNNYNTEPGFDGGRLEISVNGGAFQEIITAGGSFVEGGYNGTIGNTDSIFTGLPAWTGNSGGFITTTAVLPPSSYGQNAQFRWHTAYDSGTNPGGMRIDTVSIYTATRLCCSGACVITCPSTPITVPNDPGQCGAIVTFPLPSYTGNCGTVTASPPSGSFFQVGTTTVTVTGRRLDGTFDTCTFNVVVNDTEFPVVSAATVDKPSLWPPLHQMIPVTVNYTATDNCSVTCTLSVTSNEPIDGLGDGDTAPDWVIVDSHHVQLRSERSGKGNGRIYTITVTCADPAGNTVTRTVTVRVPMNQSTK
jgi:photosystem II stability/assembly factor-like uncharacterized protein